MIMIIIIIIIITTTTTITHTWLFLDFLDFLHPSLGSQFSLFQSYLKLVCLLLGVYYC